MPKQLIINADDYGHTPGTAMGIRRAHLEGVVTSTSAMMNSPHINSELPILIEECPRIGIGVHLVMTHGKPLLPVTTLPTLMSLSPDGRSFIHYSQDQLDQIDPEEVRCEWQAQIDKFIWLAGRAPDHLDAHHHAMCFGKNYFEIYLELAARYGCAVRRAVDDTSEGWLEQIQPAHTVPMPDRLDTRFYDEGINEGMLEQMIDEIATGTTEWMCHPAIVDTEIINISDYNILRGTELDLLTRPALRRKLDLAGISLVTFGDLPGRQQPAG